VQNNTMGRGVSGFMTQRVKGTDCEEAASRWRNQVLRSSTTCHFESLNDGQESDDC
jgi:hypothetical protein